MTASKANGFAQVLFQPNASACSSRPYDFHPMYSTASEHTRVPWAAHSYNIAYSDEIGHFEFCPNVKDASIAAGTGVCASASATDPAGPDDDDTTPSGFCFTKDMSSLVRINGCTNSDDDFDGPEYQNNWPGTNPNPLIDRLLHAAPVRFTSPLIGGERNYDRIAYETDLPRIEADQGCNRTTGANCTNPPQGASFYPFFTTGDLGGDSDRDRDDRMREACVWREGGRFLPGTEPGNFTSSTDEYGGLLQLTYPGVGFQPVQRFNDYRRVVPLNPCRASERRLTAGD
jgi:hypothetical protein